MRATFPLALVLGVLLSPTAGAAQDEPLPVLRGIYYKCDQSKEARADEVFEAVVAPVLDRHLSEGNLAAWGWLAHSVGGEWRRVAYWAALGRDALLDVTDQVVEELASDHAEAMGELSAACPTHDDYIWNSVTGSEGPEGLAQDRPAASLSTYYVCDISREARADTLVTEAFAPIFNRHVEAGNISGWSWLAHSVGGKVRRLGVFEGPDHKAILNAREMILADVASEAPDAGREFSQICGMHDDYLWNIVHSKP